MHTNNPRPSSDDFEVVSVAPGVWAALGVPGGTAVSNSGIIDLGDQTLIFDTFDSPRAASDLEQTARQLTERAATFVINSHLHADHCLGNQVFAPQTPIVATSQTRNAMPQATEWIRELQADPSQLHENSRQIQERLQTCTDPRWRVTLEYALIRSTNWIQDFATLEFCYPSLTFDQKLVFHGSKRSAELHVCSQAHSISDAYLVLPQERIMFTGDLAFVGRQPYMAFCMPPKWMAWLDEACASDIETFVPGHGGLATSKALVLQKAYMTLVLDRVSQAVEQNLDPEAVLAQPLPEPFEQWLHGGMTTWEINIYSMFERLAPGRDS